MNYVKRVMGVEKKVYSFRFEQEMVEQLQAYAKADNRTLSNLVETILKQYLKEQEKTAR